MAVQHRVPGETFAGYTDLVVETCCVCGVMFGMPDILQRKARDDHDRWFFCPNGHTQHYTGKTDAQRLQEERERRTRLQARLDQTEASLTAQRGQTTRARNERDRLKTRAANGVCPCCNRSFKQLRRHMANKHPDYKGDTHGEG